MYRRLKRPRRVTSQQRQASSDGQQASSAGANAGDRSLREDLESSLAAVRAELAASSDLVTRRLSAGGRAAAIVYLAGMIEVKLVHEAVVAPLMAASGDQGEDFLELLAASVISAASVERVDTLDLVVSGITAGKTAIFVAGIRGCLMVETQGWEKRAVEEPRSEMATRGPRESFIESLQANLALMRRRIRDPNLTVERLTIGQRTRTEVALLYLRGLAPKPLVAEVRRRLKRIDTDAILDAGYVEQFIEDDPYTPFPTVGFSERPDVVAGRLLEGRVAIFVDGAVEALTVPFLFLENFQSPQDYYERVVLATLVRIFRYVAFGISILAAPIYVALVTFHQDLIPTQLLLTIASAREATPFPTAAAVIGLGLVFEILREAGVRLPRPVGQAVSIVGVLVVGQAAVAAGFVESTTVIIISLTAISSFLNPTLTEAGIVIRLLLTIIAGTFGGYGVGCGALALLVHLTALRSFGSPYLSPVVPSDAEAILQDVVARAPLWSARVRPREVTGLHTHRVEAGQGPRSPRQPRRQGSG